MFHAAKRRTALDTQYEGLVFGRLDIDHALLTAEISDPHGSSPSGSQGHVATGSNGSSRRTHLSTEADREVRTSAASACATTTRSRWSSTGGHRPPPPFYRATPPSRMGVVRRRMIQSAAEKVTRHRGRPAGPRGRPDRTWRWSATGRCWPPCRAPPARGMRDIVATIQREQDEAIRSPASGVTIVTGGPGTGKTAVALHRAAYLLYSDRARFAGGGILVVGPSRRLRRLHRLGAALAGRGHRDAAVARRPRGRHARRALRPAPCGPREGLDAGARPALGGGPRARAGGSHRVPGHGRGARGAPRRARARPRAVAVLRQHQRNQATAAAQSALGEAAWVR